MENNNSSKGKPSSLERYETNPFLDEFKLSVRSKQVRVSKLGPDNNVLINNDTGEVKGTFVGTYKQVDDEQFLKLFTSNIALTFDLKASGIKALNVVCWLMQSKSIQKDIILIDKYTLIDFNKTHNKKLSRAVLYRGIEDLINNKILARNQREGQYFINPNFIFNGDRMVFATVIERKKRS